MHCVQDVLVRIALLVKQHELFPVPYLSGGEREQLFAWGCPAVDERIGSFRPADGREVLLKELDKRAASLPSEHACCVWSSGKSEQVAHRVLGGVVKVGGTCEVPVVPIEVAVEILEVAAVSGDLDCRVRDASIAVLRHTHECVAIFKPGRFAPLLKFDDNERWIAGPGMNASEDDVCALACQR